MYSEVILPQSDPWFSILNIHNLKLALCILKSVKKKQQIETKNMILVIFPNTCLCELRLKLICSYIYFFRTHVIDKSICLQRSFFLKKWGKIRKIPRRIQNICKSICLYRSFSIFSPRVSSELGDFWGFSIPIFCDKTHRGSAANTYSAPEPCVHLLTISIKDIGEHMWRPCLPGYLYVKFAT